MTRPIRLLKALAHMVWSFGTAAAGLAVDVAALVWLGRATLIEAAGAVCLAVFVDVHVDHGAWLVAAVALLAKSVSLEARAKR